MKAQRHGLFKTKGRMMPWSHAKGRKFCRKIDLFQARLIFLWFCLMENVAFEEIAVE